MTKDAMRVLAILEEAGDEAITPLMNMMNRQMRAGLVPKEFFQSLLYLARNDMIRISSDCRADDGRLISMNIDDSIDAISKMHDQVEWSAMESMWIWTSTDYRPEVILTDKGMAASISILRQYGTPDYWDDK